MTDLSSRTKVTPRSAPYFQRISPGRHLGFRKLEDGGTWLARSHPKGGERRHHPIGPEEGRPIK